MVILGVAAHSHDSASCLLRDGRLVAAAQEERFSRVKHDRSLPLSAIQFCLARAGTSIHGLDCLAYFEDPVQRHARYRAWVATPAEAPHGEPPLPSDVLARIRQRTGFEGPIATFEHHQSHAAAAFCYSGLNPAAVLIVDGVGEWLTTSFWEGVDGGLKLLYGVRFPHSIGLVYSAVTDFLGFRVNEGEFKVMGLAAYGTPRHLGWFLDLFHAGPGLDYSLDLSLFDFSGAGVMHREGLADVLGLPPRRRNEPVRAEHADVAASVQCWLEHVLVHLATCLSEQTECRSLCLGGGVALNCAAVGRIRATRRFDRIFVPPAPTDAGSCLGAAALAHQQLTGRPPVGGRLPHAFCGGPSPGEREKLSRDLARTAQSGEWPPGAFRDFADSEPALLDYVVRRLTEGAIVGWFEGEMEFGPRALGGRSILADPRRVEMRDRINTAVKQRETFRPFAPAALEETAARHFLITEPNRFMTELAPVTSSVPLPAVTHADGTARVQTVPRLPPTRFRRLIECFADRTGCPVLLNTSFNLKDMPIVRTELDALRCFLRSGMDTLVLSDVVIEQAQLPVSWRDLALERPVPDRALREVPPQVYTFI